LSLGQEIYPSKLSSIRPIRVPKKAAGALIIAHTNQCALLLAGKKIRLFARKKPYHAGLLEITLTSESKEQPYDLYSKIDIAISVIRMRFAT
jgi:hypothetical protein